MHLHADASHHCIRHAYRHKAHAHPMVLALACRFHLPEPLTPVNLEGLKAPKESEASSHEKVPKSAIAAVFQKQIDPSLTWDFVPWVRSFCKLPILVKVGLVTLSMHMLRGREGDME